MSYYAMSTSVLQVIRYMLSDLVRSDVEVNVLAHIFQISALRVLWRKHIDVPQQSLYCCFALWKLNHSCVCLSKATIACRLKEWRGGTDDTLVYEEVFGRCEYDEVREFF